jgi:hypothetical protein
VLLSGVKSIVPTPPLFTLPGGKAKISPLGRATVLALAHVYYYRLASTADRENYEYHAIKNVVNTAGRTAKRIGFDHLGLQGSFKTFLLR